MPQYIIRGGGFFNPRQIVFRQWHHPVDRLLYIPALICVCHLSTHKQWNKLINVLFSLRELLKSELTYSLIHGGCCTIFCSCLDPSISDLYLFLSFEINEYSEQIASKNSPLNVQLRCRQEFHKDSCSDTVEKTLDNGILLLEKEEHVRLYTKA